jgi:hypothetical protein
MQIKRFPIVLLAFVGLTILPLVAQAATFTVCTLDRDTYHQGETGFVTVTIYNDKENKIRVTELTATIDYYYTEGIVYLQGFYTNATLPLEIQQGQSSTFHIPFSLPTNVASGYTKMVVKAKTDLWNGNLSRWSGSEHPTYQPTLYIESPYKDQIDEQLAINRNTTNMMYLFGFTTLVFAVVAGFLFILNRRARFATQPVA